MSAPTSSGPPTWAARAASRTLLFLGCVALLAAAGGCREEAPGTGELRSLGKSVFFDANLSINRNQSCGTCHAPGSGWVVPEDEVNAAGSVYEGSVSDRFGTRKPMSAAYATFAPVLRMRASGEFVGGNFWDGRATGEDLGTPSADQVHEPLLNPVEQGLTDPACVVFRVTTNRDYVTTYAQVWGATGITWPTNTEPSCGERTGRVALSEEDRVRSDAAMENIERAVAAFEGSPEVSAFSSKFDAVAAGRAVFTEQE